MFYLSSGLVLNAHRGKCVYEICSRKTKKTSRGATCFTAKAANHTASGDRGLDGRSIQTAEARGQPTNF